VTRLRVTGSSRRFSPGTPARCRAAAGLLIVLAAGLTAFAVSGAPPSALAGGGEPTAALRVPGTGDATAGSRLTAQTPLPASSTVTLITGDRVRLDVLPDGQQNASVLASPRDVSLGSSFVEFSWAGDQYVVPDPAVPYLGSVLDPRLFDVSYLVRAGLADAHASTLPVSITYRGGAPRPGLPALHVTRAAGQTAAGTIAKDRAGLLGQLLASRWRSARAGRAPGGVGVLPGVQRISLLPPAGAPMPPRLPWASTIQHAARGVPYRTLRLSFTGLDGRPAVAAGFVQDVNNARLALFTTSGNGSVSVSVPEGTYSLEFSVLTPHSSGPGFDTALVVKPQVAVHANETVRLDARAARPLRVTLRGAAAPRVQENVLDYTRASQTGGRLLLGPYDILGLRLVSVTPTPAGERGNLPSELLATPTPPVTKGTFGFHAYSFFSSTALGADRQSAAPTYFLSFPYSGAIPPSLTYRVPTAKLSTVHERLYRPPGTPLSDCGVHGAQAGMVYTVYSPWDGNVFALGDLTPVGRRTDYWYTSNPRLDVWQAAYNGCDYVRSWGPIERIRPGEQISGSWGKAPMVPSPAAPPAYAAGAYALAGFASHTALDPWLTVCPACRQGDIGMLNLLPFGDSDPSHYAEDFAGDSKLLFYRDGKLAVTSAAAEGGHLTPFAFDLPMLPNAARYRLDWRQTVPGGRGAYNDTAWTFRSAADAAHRRLARTEQCAPEPTQTCTFLPLLFVNYDLALDSGSRTQAGKPFRVAFTVGHQQNESAATGLTATVSVSYNDGRTWTAPRPATGEGGGKFRLTIDQPPLRATAGNVSLRVTARDHAGSSVVQTITHAYGLYGAAVAKPGAVSHRHACASPRPGHAACLVITDTVRGGRRLTMALAAAGGLHPYQAAQLQAAYRLPSARRGRGQTIAIVDAYNDPRAAADLAVYRRANHLPGCPAARCLRKVSQDGGSSPPRANGGWAEEESLDLDMASATCPHCKIVLVEARSNSFRNLGMAENEAARLGADVISNSYAGPEYPGEAAEAAAYAHPGVAITASSGDGGFGVSVPAAFPTVTAVGGTSLYRSHTARGWSETAWPLTGAGCSAYIAKPPWQRDRLCGNRTVADTAAVANPDTPVAIYDTYHSGGWTAVGGTSVAAPLIAGVYALAGNARSIKPGGYLYSHHQHLFDVTSGSDGSCGGSYLCAARPGYDGPTGWGTPDGTGAF
jgi:hypothetical protein